MERIGDRISIKKHENFTTLIISTKVDSWQIGAMFVWLIAWILVGVGIVYSIFTEDFSRDTKLFFWAFMVFWAYFLFRIGKTYLWRKFGMEFIKVDADVLSVKNSIKGYGKAHIYRLHDVKNIDVVKVGEKSVGKVLNDSFWVIGDGLVNFQCQDKKFAIGKQLNSHEANELKNALRKVIQAYQRNTEKAVRVS